MSNHFKTTKRSGLLPAIVFTLSFAFLHAQTPAPRPLFEVASVKLHQFPPTGSIRRGSPGAATYIPPGFSSDPARFVAQQMRLGDLIEFAYGIPSDRIEGQPDWAKQNSWDILATMPAPADLAQQKLMLQTLLEDRFALRVTRKSKEGPVYALVLGKKPTLTASHENAGPAVGRIRLARMMMQEHSMEMMAIGTHVSVSDLADWLSPPSRCGRPVFDKTGLSGFFDITINVTGEPPDLHPSDYMSAVRSEMGLDFKPQTGIIEFLTIDRVERPSAN